MLCFSIDTNFLIHEIYIYIGTRLNITVGIQEDNQVQQKNTVKVKFQIPKVKKIPKRRAK